MRPDRQLNGHCKTSTVDLRDLSACEHCRPFCLIFQGVPHPAGASVERFGDYLSDDLTHWRAALRGAAMPLHENDPQPGYWRLRAWRGGPWVPVAIWRDPDGSLKALKGGQPADAQALWTWCCRHPIAYEAYCAVAEEGQPWPEEAPLAAGLGHNAGPALVGDDHGPLAVTLRALADLRQRAEAWLAEVGTPATQGEADTAANFAEAFARLEREAEEARVAEKAPVLAKGRAIDEAWKPLLAAAAAGKRHMKEALTPYLLAEEERRRAQSEQNGAIGTGACPPRAGTVGRRVGLRRESRCVVTDRDALVRAYRRDVRFWAHAGVMGVLAELAEADLRAGRRVRGAELIDHVVAA
jgi:hypothetical protein